MAFVVEDGTGKIDATSFTTVAFYKEHFTDRGNTAALALTDEQIELALMEGTLYVNTVYHALFTGHKSTSWQSLQYPRMGVRIDGFAITNYSIPKLLQEATCEAAFLSLTEDWYKPVKMAEAAVIELTAGPITKKWAPGQSSPTKIYPIIDLLMRPLIFASYGIIETVRG